VNASRTKVYLTDQRGCGIFNGAMSLYQPLDATIIAPVLTKHRGNVTMTAVEIGIDSARLRAYVKAKPELLAIIEEAKEQLLDEAESVVWRALEYREPGIRDNAAKFVLSTIGKDRELGKHANIIDIRTREPLIVTWVDSPNSSRVKPEAGSPNGLPPAA
jgi:hypothetical protein